MENTVLLVTTIGGLLSAVAFTWYYAALGKRISNEENEEGKDLTYQLNPFTGSSKGDNQNN
ncbi:hypothetical protein MHB63_05150 [Bacillus sp. FSL H8-0547]